MFAPVVEKGAVGRSVYFPGNFYNFHDGNRFVGPAYYNITNIVIDPIPIFIAEGHGVFVQDVTNVTKTSQLNNIFNLVAGLKKD
jgi:alpha-glucosidase (family GH31 glycosyl hydrolase)